MPADPVMRHLRHVAMKQLPGSVAERRRALARMERLIGCPLLEASPEQLLDWRESLHVAPGTIATYVGHAREFYGWAVEQEMITENPAAQLPVPRVPRRLPRPIADEDLLPAVLAAPQPIRLMLVLGGWCGLRAQEIARCPSSSIQFAHGVIYVTAEMAKGWRERNVRMSPYVADECRMFGLPRSGMIFRLASNGRLMKPWTVSKIVNEYLHDRGISETVHCCRHRFATQLLAQCHDIRIVQEQLGHASPTSTAIYTKVIQADAAAAVDALPVPLRIAA